MELLSILTYITWDIDPDIFVIPFVNHPVRWYGLFWVIGIVLSQRIMTYIYKKEGRPPQEIDTMTLYIVAGTMVGARLGHVLFYDPIGYLQNPLRILYIWEGGLASHGGTVGILVAAYLLARKTKVGYLWLLDRLVIVAALAGCCIRVGNLMNSEMVGLPTDLPWGVIFTSVDSKPRHPAQLYEAVYCLLLFALTFGFWAQRRKRMREGFLLGCFLVTLFSLRFVDEFFKMNQVAFEDNMVLNMGQILSIPFVLIGLVLLVLNLRKVRGNATSERGRLTECKQGG
ncbi:prolipoprotein diacylglyceryl transferase [Rufibacter immobilis]|uniref:prolipoprotein diacylglyceryl transferase n=1 Tax=Rufibacter immobilis TaxID=1348778 RepID=UPI0035E66603